MSIGLLGKKIGMTRLYDDKGRATPATVIEAGGNRILQLKTTEKDGYPAVQLGYGDQKPQRIGKAMAGHFAKSSSTPKRFIREFRLADGAAAPESADVPVSNFEIGQFVDVIGQSKGKGFQGTIKRWNFTMGDATHGNSLSHRSPGSIGQRQTPGRECPGKKMSGHMGAEVLSVQNLEVVKVDVERGLIAIRGAVPGAPGGDVVVRPASKG
jgi:large subunit ribosomal protein L3